MTRRLILISLAGGIALAGSLSAAATDQPTYSRDIAPIFNQSCVSCHRPGQIGPMALRTYDEVRPWVKSIARNVEARLMPPWHADPSFGTFANDRSLEQDEIDTIVRWASRGAPQGDAADLLPTPEFADGEWLLGEPDFIVEFEQVMVPAGGPDQFHNLIGKVMLPDDQWITAVEVKPGNPRVVHHVIALQFRGFDIDPAEGWLGAWAAGTPPMVFPEGTGRLLKAGSNIIGDMHYHPTDSEETDVTRIGLHFADGEIDKQLENLWVINERFKIPAGAENHEVRSSYTIWQDGKIIGLIPHMHYRGKDFTFTATYPDGRQEVLLRVPRWDFNWQTTYSFKQPVSVPAGTVIETLSHYDNSANNPANPDPTIDVTFGDESYDEMHIGFVDFIVDEGVGMRPLTEIRREMLPEIAGRHPGEVYAVTAGSPANLAPLHLPRQGEGTFFVIYNGNLVQARVWDVVWQGNEFAGSVEGPDGQAIPFSGKLLDGGAIETRLGETPFNGSLWQEGSPSSGL